jgi:hypothetical protein
MAGRSEILITSPQHDDISANLLLQTPSSYIAACTVAMRNPGTLYQATVGSLICPGPWEDIRGVGQTGLEPLTRLLGPTSRTERYVECPFRGPETKVQKSRPWDSVDASVFCWYISVAHHIRGVRARPRTATADTVSLSEDRCYSYETQTTFCLPFT